jgi:two-component system CheB/CheR fusion protein
MTRRGSQSDGPGEEAKHPQGRADTSGAPEPAVLRHVVAIGASAGGLEALQAFVGGLEAGGTTAYVVAQHLAPEHRSLIVDLLARATRLPVIAASDGRRLTPDVICVGPPRHDLLLEKDVLRIREPEARFGPSPCIDLLFDSLADHWKEHGVAVVLSGTGSDGARGLRAVRAAGGLTIAQTPASAKFDGMPSAAISIGGADLVLEPAQIGPRISELLGGSAGWIAPPRVVDMPVNLATITAQLKHDTGIDFSEYKESTVRRQVQRRMAIRQITAIDDYLPLLEADPEESRALLQNLLVTVTSFFRDGQAFEGLKSCLATYLEHREEAGPVRLWVPGCATGEEVYSLAMVLSEVMGHPADLAGQLKIFGTDLDEHSLMVARHAAYPVSEAPAIPADLRQRFVSDQGGELVIHERLRACAVFASHNVGQDPPFPRLDLVSCRNTLIYFTAPMQERVLRFFRFSLLPGGLLFLGNSESLGARSPGFELIDSESHIYQRLPEVRERQRPVLPVPIHRQLWPHLPGGRMTVARESVPEQHMSLLTAVVRSFCPPGLVLDEDHQVVEVIGDVSPYCRLPEGRLSTGVHAFLAPELQTEARALFLLVRADGVAVRSPSLRLQGQDTSLHLEARPLELGENRMTMLSFVAETTVEGGAAAAALAARDPAFDSEIERLEKELLASQTSLRQSLAELEAANEELEASSEELQASSEELQSSNEELESSNEELQATNEELGTLNEQLRARSDELQLLSNDRENIQTSLNQGMVIVDRQLRVTRYSPLAVRVFALVEDDLGQPLVTVPTTVPIPGLREALEAVVAGESRRTLEAGSEEVAYLVQMMPYLERDGRRRGAILTLTDVSELVALRRAAEAALNEFSRLTDALQEAVWKRDPGMQRMLYASRRFQALTGWTPSELCDNAALLDGAIDEADRERVRASRDVTLEGWSLRYRLTTRDGRRIWVEESAKVMHDDSDCFVVGTLCDVTRSHDEQEHADQVSAIFEAVYNCRSFGVAVLDPRLRLLMANDHLAELTGRSAGAMAGLALAEVCPEIVEAAQALVQGAERGENPASLLRRMPLVGADRSGREVDLELVALPRVIGEAAGLLVVRPVA